MNRRFKWLIPVICIVILFSIGGGYYIYKSNYIPTEIKYIDSGDTDVNLSDPREVVGVSRYVFVGYVEETYDYYTTKNEHQFPEIINYYDQPFTECRVKVIANIKGNLTLDNILSFYKTGGVSEDRNYIYLNENDIIPEVGKYYIFTGIAHADGTMTGGGSNGTITLEPETIETNIQNSNIYQKYLDAYKNQILPSTESLYPDYLCTGDANFNDGIENARMYDAYLNEQRIQNESEAKVQAKTAENYFDEEYDKAVKAGNPQIK